jgi:hypothetical protein
MEIFLAILFLLTFLGWLGSSYDNIKSLTYAWSTIYLFGGLSRLGLELSPVYAASFSTFLLFLGAGVGGLRLIRTIQSKTRLCSWDHLPLYLVGFFLLARSYFPQFDTDSLLYHLFTLEWLAFRDQFPPIHQITENFLPNVRFIGLEEYCAIPGLNLDLALYAGLLQGCFKIFSTLTFVLLLPRVWPFLRYVAIFLVLIDDHFFFSGHSSTVYLTPSILGQLTLTFFIAWKFAKGKQSYFFPLCVLTIGMMGTKYQGLIFSVGLLPLIAYGLFRYGCPTKNVSAWAMPIFSSVILVFSFYGLNWIETGTPLYPFTIGPLTPHYLDYYEVLTGRGSFWGALANPFQLLIVPGNLVLKATAVLFLPVILLYFASSSKSLPVRAGVIRFSHWRYFGFCSYVLFITIIFAAIFEFVHQGGSRWPRFPYLLAGLALCLLAIDLRRSIRFIPQSLKQARSKQTLQVLGGLVIFAYLVFTVDTRYFNVPQSQRPTWRDIYSFAVYFQSMDHSQVGLDPSYPPSLRAPMVWPLLLPSITDVYATQPADCFEHLSHIDANEETLLGKGVLVFSPGFLWPSLITFPFAVRGDPHAAYLRLPEGHSSLVDAGIRWVIYPRSWRTNGIREAELRNPLAAVVLKKIVPLEPDCLTERLAIVQIPGIG